MGVWSTREPRADTAIVLEALSELSEGGVSEPVDSSVGFQIVKRLAPSASSELAMRAIKIPIGDVIFRSDAPGSGTSGDPSTPDPARAEAERIVRILRRNPEAFPSVIAGRCCRAPERWIDGHGDPILTSSIEALRIGELTPEPVRVEDFWVVAQRIDPESTCPHPRPLWGLPSPSSIDLEAIVRGNSSAQLASEMANLAPVVASLGLSQTEQSAFAGSLDRFRTELSTASTPDARVRAYRQNLNAIRASLSESAYSRVVSLLETWASARMLGLSAR
jgi:hypothetical protein